MSKLKKILIPAVAVVAAGAIAAAVFLNLPEKVEAFTGVETFDETVHFTSSFEDGESKTFLQSTLEPGTAVNLKAAGQTGGDSPLMTVGSNGPSVNWGGISETGWTGDKALKIHGIHQGKEGASASNVIFKDMNLPVTADTHLSYVLYPSTLTEDSYDYAYTPMYLCVDAVFTDGTYLSDLGAVDQNGFGYNPVSQGQSDSLYTNQWNFIRVNIGSVAAGKTLDRLLVAYEKPDNANGRDSEFISYLDDVTLSDITNMDYDHLSDYVDIRRGSNSTSEFSRGLIVPAVTYPSGFNFFTPVTTKGSNLPYYYQLSGERTTLSSLSIEHIASYWVGDWGTWQFMPSTAVDASSVRSDETLKAENRAATFTHSKETATCYYYSVQFEEDSKASGVFVELTPTMYGAVVRFTFPEGSDNTTLIFDSENGSGIMKFAEDGKSMTATSNDTNTGSRMMYVYATFNEAFESSVAKGSAGAVTFPKGTTSVEMTLATSFISYDQAEKNYGFDFKKTNDFDKVCAYARKTWDDTLGKVEIEGATFTQKVSFYSCLYRTHAYPNLYRENTGTEAKEVWKYASPYAGNSKKPAIVNGSLVCNTGLWDTYRTAWPWYATISKDTTLIEGLLGHYVESGWNGAWMGCRGSQIMIGTHSDIIYADAAVKGLRYNYDLAMMSMMRNASAISTGSVGREEQETSVFTGYVSNETPRGLSWTLDNCLNDFGLYVLAEKLGMADEAAYYKNRAKAYVTVYYADAGFYLGKDKNGNWSTSASSYDPTDWRGDYTESNGWNMAFNMVYDPAGMASLYGGLDKMAEKLDEMFSTPITNVNKNSIHEIREGREVRLGQYVHSNQVAHHLAYMYDLVGQPYKTQKLVRSVLDRCYVGAEIGQGYVGDEDNGEQSAWYVYSALGFYPTALASGQYTIGSPLFTKATLHLETGDVTITANNNSHDNVYIASCTVNGEPWNKPYLTYEQFDGGADIVFEMTNQPTSWGMGEENLPYSLTPYGETVSYMTDSTKQATVTANGNDLGKLTDDTSETAVTFSGDKAEIVLAYKNAFRAQIVTLTSAKSGKSDLTSYKLAASNDGQSWVTLDERTDTLAFEWAQFTRPLAVPADKQGSYTYYRVTFTGDKSPLKLAELELIG